MSDTEKLMWEVKKLTVSINTLIVLQKESNDLMKEANKHGRPNPNERSNKFSN